MASPVMLAIRARLGRRAVLRGIGWAAGGLALRGTAARAATAEVGLVELPPNPAGSFERLYGVVGYTPGMKAAHVGGRLAAKLAAEAGPERRTLRIVHYNDMHNFLEFDDPEKGETHALAQIVAHAAKARAKAKADEAVILVTAGDDRSGTRYDQLLGDIEGNGFVVDPAYTAYAAAGVDASAIGNHEFDHGSRTLRAGIRGAAKFPLLSANLSGSRVLEPGRDYFPAAVGVVKGLRVGLIGLSPVVIKHYRKAGETGIELASAAATLAELLPAVAELSDVVVILSHCGYGEDYGPARASDGWRFYIREGDFPVARAAAKLTGKPLVIVGGHTHTVLNKTGLEPQNLVDGVPILQAGAHGRYVGEAVLTLRAGEPTRVSARLFAVKGRNDRLAETDPDYGKAEHDGDFDRGFDARVIAPLRARLKA